MSALDALAMIGRDAVFPFVSIIMGRLDDAARDAERAIFLESLACDVANNQREDGCPMKFTDENDVPTVAGANAMFAAIDEAKAQKAWRDDVAARQIRMLRDAGLHEQAEDAEAQPPHVYAWRRRSLTTEHAATITLARWTGGCSWCSFGCTESWGKDWRCIFCGTRATLLLVVDFTQDRRRIFSLAGDKLPAGLDFDEVPVGDPQITSDQLLQIERGHDLVLPPEARDWSLERLWGEP